MSNVYFKRIVYEVRWSELRKNDELTQKIHRYLRLYVGPKKDIGIHTFTYI